MREPVGTFEAPRGVGECSKEEIRGWGAIFSGYTSEDWPPADYWSEEEPEESVRPASENAVSGRSSSQNNPSTRSREYGRRYGSGSVRLRLSRRHARTCSLRSSVRHTSQSLRALSALSLSARSSGSNSSMCKW
jgi:hypothetical protein